MASRSIDRDMIKKQRLIMEELEKRAKLEHRIGLLREGCGTSRRVAKGVGMRAVRGSSSGGEE